MRACQPHAKYPMSSGTNLTPSYRCRRRLPKADAPAPTIARYSTGGYTSCGRGVRGGRSRAKSRGPGTRSMLGLRRGNGRGSLSRFGRAGCLCRRASRGWRGNGNRQRGHLGALPWGEKEAGPNPTDRAKAGYKAQRLLEGRGGPLSVGSTAAKVNEGPRLWGLLTSLPLVRPPPERRHPHQVGLDAAFANASVRSGLLVER